MKVLALGGSLRAGARAGTFLHAHAIQPHEDLEAFRLRLGRIKAPTFLSNSEIVCLMAAAGASQAGAEIEFENLSILFSRCEQPLHEAWESDWGVEDRLRYFDTLSIDTQAFNRLSDLIRGTDAVLIASPVYFGDRSSVVSRFLSLAKRDGLLKGKLVAALSVGAKRNGGQETTNVSLLSEVSGQGAIVVGNGPPSCQFGGTAIGGDRASVLLDPWGLESAYQTGKQIALTSSRMASHSGGEGLPHVVAVLTMDNPARDLLSSLRKRADENRSRATMNIIDLTKLGIERCLGCDVCPIPSLRVDEHSYGCIIRSARDGMRSLREQLVAADAIVIAGVNCESDDLVDRYQVFVERSRFIRRNDFELSFLPTAAYLWEEAGSQVNRGFCEKVLTSFLRHNVPIYPALREIRWRDELIAGAGEKFADFVSKVKKRGAEKLTAVRYEAVGYEDRTLDATISMR